MRKIDGEIMFTVADCSCYIKKSVQTLHKYDKYSDILESRGEARLIPKPLRINGQRLYTKEQVKKIQHFIETKKRGQMGMAEFNRKRLGKRGEDIEKRMKAKEKEQARKQEEKKGKELEVALSKVNRAVSFKDRFKHIKRNL